jgi:hypothetical protein
MVYVLYRYPVDEALMSIFGIIIIMAFFAFLFTAEHGMRLVAVERQQSEIIRRNLDSRNLETEAHQEILRETLDLCKERLAGLELKDSFNTDDLPIRQGVGLETTSALRSPEPDWQQ